VNAKLLEAGEGIAKLQTPGSLGLLGEREREREREKWVAGTVSVGRDGDGSRAPFIRGRRSAGSRVEIGGLRWSERAGQCRLLGGSRSVGEGTMERGRFGKWEIF